MKTDKKLIIIAVITYLLLVLIEVYFKYFPTIINSKVTNFVIVGSTFLLISSLVYGIFLIKNPIDISLILPQALIFIFIARAVPHLRLSYPPLHDPYYYFITSLNIIQYGTLQPIMKWWYSQIDMQLHYPALHILTATLTQATGIEPMLFARFLNPALGLVFFLGVYLVVKEITKNIKISLLAALFSSLIDILIFYQSEYHPQGLSFTVFILLIYAFIKFDKNRNLIHFLLVGMFMILLLFTHHFTSIFIALIFALYLVFLIAYNLASQKDIKISTILNTYKADILVIGCYLTLVLFYNFIYYKRMVKIFYSMTTGSLTYPLIIPLVSISACIILISSLILIRRNKNFLKKSLTNRSVATIIIIIATAVTLFLYYRNINSLLHLLAIYKVFLFMLAFIYIMEDGLWVKETNLTRSMVLFFSIILSGVIGFYSINKFPVDRVIGFSAPFACIFASTILYKFSNAKKINKHSALKSERPLLTILIVSSLITFSFFNSQIPAFFFKDSKVDTSYWYSNILPSMTEYKICGSWVNKITKQDSTYYTKGTCLEIPFYFAKRSNRNILFIDEMTDKKTLLKIGRLNKSKFVITSSHPNELLYNSRYTPLNTIYSSNRIKIFK